MLEYDRGKAAAIVEYKNEHAAPQYASHPTYQALIDLGTRAGIPVIACRYTDDFQRWKVVPLNDKAKEYLPIRQEMTEREYITLLYRFRGQEIPQGVLQGLDVEI